MWSARASAAICIFAPCLLSAAHTLAQAAREACGWRLNGVSIAARYAARDPPVLLLHSRLQRRARSAIVSVRSVFYIVAISISLSLSPALAFDLASGRLLMVAGDECYRARMSITGIPNNEFSLSVRRP